MFLFSLACRWAVGSRLGLPLGERLSLLLAGPEPWFAAAALLASILLGCVLSRRRLLLAVLAAVALLLAQAAWLLRAIRSRGDPLSANGAFSLVASPDPVECRGGRCVREKTNALGFRGPALRPERTSARRVLLIGDSFVFGSGVEDEDTLDARLRERLRREDPKTRWEVGNFGVPGFNFASDVRQLETLAPRFSPDTVVIGFLRGNDLVPADPRSHREALGPFLWKAASRFGLEARLLELELRRYDQARLAAPDIRDAFARDLARLRALRDERGIRVLIFSYFGKEPLLARGSGFDILWPEPWQSEPGLALPGDGHPTGKANERFARQLAAALTGRTPGSFPQGALSSRRLSDP